MRIPLLPLVGNVALVIWSAAAPLQAAPPQRAEIEAAMNRATRFMADKAAYRGGYVWAVSEDLTQRWGEVPARPSQIWVQQATPDVGMAMLAAHEATGDPEYLEVARRAAAALIFGQHPLGGWHYFVDFEPGGLRDWYESGRSSFKWGYEEYRHYYGNCTFDDGVTAVATRFLLRLYLVTLDPAYRASLLKALDFVLLAQYPNGAWPQRYPLRQEFVHDGFPDYTSYYTLNDGAAQTNIELLLEAHERLGDERYLDAARRGVEFLIAVQGPEGQAGWAEQYGPDLRPAIARTHEPAGYVVRESVGVIRLLERLYAVSGDRRYLAPVPRCLDWLERVQREATTSKRPFARYYEPGSNLPIYVLRTERTSAEGFGLYDWTHEAAADTPAYPFAADVAQLRNDYARLAALSTDELRGEPGRRWRQPAGDGPQEPLASAEKIIRSLDARGAWVEEVRVLEVAARGLNPGTFEKVHGISTQTFVRNMRLLTAALRSLPSTGSGR